MDAGGHPLWQKLVEFQFDDPAAASPFSARLAKEQRWTAAFTTAAIEEYRRFLFLAAVADHVVTPSKVVDEVWHLHLIYTKSYWKTLCQDTLGKPLHHHPSEGGREETLKFEAQYARTLASYEHWFGRAAPDAHWGTGEPVKPVKRVRLRNLTLWIARFRSRYLGTVE